MLLVAVPCADFGRRRIRGGHRGRAPGRPGGSLSARPAAGAGTGPQPALAFGAGAAPSPSRCRHGPEPPARSCSSSRASSSPCRCPSSSRGGWRPPAERHAAAFLRGDHRRSGRLLRRDRRPRRRRSARRRPRPRRGRRRGGLRRRRPHVRGGPPVEDDRHRLRDRRRGLRRAGRGPARRGRRRLARPRAAAPRRGRRGRGPDPVGGRRDRPAAGLVPVRRDRRRLPGGPDRQPDHRGAPRRAAAARGHPALQAGSHAVRGLSGRHRRRRVPARHITRG